MKGLRFSLSRKALLAVFLILLPIVIAFIYGYAKNEERLKKHLLEDLTVVSEVFEGQVYQFLEMSRRRTVDFSTDALIKEALEKNHRGAGFSFAELNRHLLENKLPLDPHMHDIHVLNDMGKVVSSTDLEAVGKDFSGEQFFRSGIAGNPYTEYSAENNLAELAVTAPVYNGKKPVGMVVSLMKLVELNKVLSGELSRELGAITWGKGERSTLEAYLVNSEKLMLTNSKFIKDAILKQKVDTEPVRACVGSGRELTGFYLDYRSIEVAGASMCLPPLKWTLLVEIDSDEALAPARQMKRDAIITGFFVAGLLVLLFVFLNRAILQIRRLSQAASSIAEGEYDITIPVRTNDEIGALSETFNKMALDIKARDHAIRDSEEKYRSLVSNIPDVIWTATPEGTIHFISENIEDVLGYTVEDIKASPGLWFESIHKDDVEAVRKAYEALFGENSIFDVEYRLKTKDGRWVWLHDRATSTYTKDGGVKFADGVFSDITKRKAAEEALKENERLLNEAQHIARLGSWVWEIPANKLGWSDEIYNIFGISRERFGATYENFISFVHPDDRERVETSVFNALYKKEPYSIDHRIILTSGVERIVHEQGEVECGDDGTPVRMLGTVQDITESRKIEFELKKLSAAIENSVNIVFITNTKGTIEYVNPIFEQITGFKRDEAIGQTPRILSSGELQNEKYEELWKTILAGKTWRSILKNRKKTGGYYWANSVISPIRDEHGEITHFLAVQEDITEKMISEERIKFLAQYDELTGLINRAHFIEQLDEWMALSAINKQTGAMLLLDMDQFKFVNDTYGHGTGDEFLRRVANLLRNTLDEVYAKNKRGGYSLLSRLSGDEFAVFISLVNENEAFGVAERLRLAMEEFRFADFLTTSTVSIGIVLYPQHGLNSRELFTRSDAAMYRAKELGRNRCHLYRPEDQDLEKMHSRLSWREKILKALKEDRFEPWFQPILDLKTDMVHHYEVLARMRDEEGKILLPGAFIDIAERFGLIGSIDRMITEKAIRMQAKTMREGKFLTFGMNLSGKNLGDEDLRDFLEARIKEAGADPSCLIFEITETAAIGDLGRAIKFIKALKSLGCKFALDDFGVGYTSFTYLKEMNVDYIKIDGSFIRKITENENDRVFVKAITDVAKGLKIQSIAEFVETGEALGVLRAFGVDYAQGYLIGKPSPVLEHIDLAKLRLGVKKDEPVKA